MTTADHHKTRPSIALGGDNINVWTAKGNNGLLCLTFKYHPAKKYPKTRWSPDLAVDDAHDKVSANYPLDDYHYFEMVGYGRIAIGVGIHIAVLKADRDSCIVPDHAGERLILWTWE